MFSVFSALFVSVLTGWHNSQSFNENLTRSNFEVCERSSFGHPARAEFLCKIRSESNTERSCPFECPTKTSKTIKTPSSSIERGKRLSVRIVHYRNTDTRVFLVNVCRAPAPVHNETIVLKARVSCRNRQFHRSEPCDSFNVEW